MPLQPQVQDHLTRLATTNFADLHLFTPEQAREGMRRMIQVLPPPAAVDTVEDRVLATSAGEVKTRIYRPEQTSALPVTVFLHGGGFVLGDLDTHDGLARGLANASSSLVVSVDYPMAPEHKFPAAPDAAYAVTQWVADHAEEIGGDPRRIAVAGDSAGGNLAAQVAIKARDEGGPDLALQLLIYPDLDFRRNNFSIQHFAGKYGNVSRDTQYWFMDHYLENDQQRLLPGVSPVLSPNLAGLAPAYIVTAEYDALRDEGEQYGALLEEAGVAVTVHRWNGMIHEFLRQSFDDSQAAVSDAGAALNNAFSDQLTMSDAEH